MFRKLRSINLPLTLLSAGLLSVLVPSLASAQTQSVVPARVIAPVDNNSRFTLTGSTHPLAQPRFDAGSAPSSLPADRLLLILKRSTRQEADLKQYLEAVQDKKSPQFHKFLTPEQFGKLYGPADSDIAAVTGWLQGQGFLVSKVNKARTAVEFSGTAGQVQSAFRTAIHSYVIGGQQKYANASDPQIPTALAPVIAGVAGLNSFRPRPFAALGPSGQFDTSAHRFKPQLTGGRSPNYFLFLGPADAATIYNAPSATLNHNFASSGGSATLCNGHATCDGSNVTIGVVGDSNINTADNDNYRAMFGLPASPTTVIVDGQDPGINADSDEALLDTQIAGGLAPGAKINLYVSADTNLQSGLILAVYRALDDNAIDILNVSFGNCEAALTAGGNQALSLAWEQAAAQGISVTVASGDSGAAGCDDPSTQTSATLGLAVNGFASTPYNVAVGGTDFDDLTAHFSTYVDTAVMTTNPPPYFGTVIAPINGNGVVIPEDTWNNSTVPNTNVAANVAYKDSTGAGNILGGGGGASTVYPKPAWQQGLQTLEGQTNIDTARDVPDVSLFASNGFYSAAWAVCRDNDCVLNNGLITAGTTIHGFGGTSTSAPAFAGILALVSQSVGSRLGQANTVLYELAAQKPGVFHDISTGDNSVPCDSASADCGTNGFLTGFDAGTGYDLATGLGSVDVTALVTYWSTVTLSSTNTTLTLNGGSANVTVVHGTPINVDGTVTATSGTPTGDVAILTSSTVANSASQGFFTLDNTGAIPPGSTISTFPGGTYQVTARYGGDANFSSSVSSPAITLTVTQEPSVANFGVNINGAPAVANTNYVYGSGVSAFVQPAGTSATPGTLNGIATGTATFSDGATKLATQTLNSTGVAEFDTTFLPAGSHSLSVAYSGDLSFGPSTDGPIAFNITKAATVSALSASPTAVFPSESVQLSTTVSTSSSGLAPGGTVDFFSGATKVGTATLTGTAGSLKTAASATATVTLLGSTLGLGADHITAVYNGDGNYTTSTSPVAMVTVAQGATTSAVATSTASIFPSQSVAVTVTIATQSHTVSPSGAVDFYAGTTKLTSVPLTGTAGSSTTLASATATATIQGSALALGANNIKAVYAGDGNFTASTSAASVVTVSQGATTTAITPSASAILATSSVTLNVAVATTVSGPAPTGSVDFYSGATKIGSSAITGTPGVPGTPAAGTASLKVQGTALTIGANSLTAVYSGDADYTTSTSAAASVSVSSSFSMTASAATPGTIAPGASASSTITVTPVGGFTGAVTLTCTVAGAKTGDAHMPTCTGGSVTFASGATAAQTASISVASTAATTAAVSYPHTNRWLAGGSTAVLACVLFFGIPARRRSWRAMLGLFAFFAVLTAVGCGGGGGNSTPTPTPVPGTSADTYTVNVSGVDSTGKITATTSFTVVVN